VPLNVEIVYDEPMPIYKNVNPFIPLSEFGASAAELNESFLVGATLSFTRPTVFEDYTLVGLETGLELAAQANQDSEPTFEDGQMIVDVAGPVLTAATGTVIEFIQDGEHLSVRFEETLATETGESLGDRWTLTSDTAVLFQP